MLFTRLYHKLLILTSITILLIGCDGGGPAAKAKLLTGYYKDAGVKGAQYHCDDQTGLTGIGGKFTFREGKSCAFYLDQGETLKLREVTLDELSEGDGVIIFEDNLAISRVLQTLDGQNGLEDGIQLDQNTIDELIAAGFDHTVAQPSLSQSNIERLDGIINGGSVVSEEEAAAHSLKTLLENTKFYQHCSGRIAERSIEEIDFSSISDYTISGNTVTVSSTIFTRNGNNLESVDGNLYVTETEAKTVAAGSCALGDTIAPIITLNGDTNIDTSHGATYTDEGATTDDSSDVVTTGNVNTGILGEYTLTYNATDVAGNIATPVTRTVTVIDDTAPVITLLGDATISNVAYGSTYTDAGATATDAVDGTVTVTTTGNVNTSTIGVYTLTYTAIDNAGNAATPVTRTVSVIDGAAPVITINGETVLTIAYGSTYSDQGATATDDIDGSVEVTTSGEVDTSTIAEYTITYSASDSIGNTSTATRTVKVTDQAAPVVTLIGASTITISHGETANYVDQGATATDNVDSTVTVITTGSVGADVGEYILTYSATDSAGLNAATVTRTINVVDNTPPVITLNGDSALTIAHGSNYIDVGATVTDNVDTNITVVTTGTVGAALGDYTLTYTASDLAGNTATEVTRTVTVADQTKPVITLIGSATITIAQGDTYTDAGANVTDNIDGNSTLTTSDTVDTSTAGSYTLKYNTTDAAGNDAIEVIRTVIVTDHEVPVISLIGNATITLVTGDTYTDAGATVTDTEDGTSTTSTPDTVDTSSTGTYTLTYNATDSAGNVATEVTRTVVVLGQFTIPSNFYDTRRNQEYNNGNTTTNYESEKFTFTADSKFSINNMSFALGSFQIAPADGESSNFVLSSGGNWIQEPALNGVDVTFSENNSKATLGNHILVMKDIKDVSGQTILPFSDSNIEVLMPNGAKKITWSHNVINDVYGIDKETSLENLDQVLSSKCGNNHFKSLESTTLAGVAFKCGQEAQNSGDLVGVTTNGMVQTGTIGTWERTTLPNSSLLAIITNLDSAHTNLDESANAIFAEKDGAIWRGYLQLASAGEQSSLYNQIAFDAIEKKLAEIHSATGSEFYQVVDGKLVMKSVSTSIWDSTSKNGPVHRFGMFANNGQDLGAVDTFEADLTLIETSTSTGAQKTSRGRVGMVITMESNDGYRFYITIYLEQRGNSLTTRAYATSIDPTATPSMVESQIADLHNKPITLNTPYKFKFKKLQDKAVLSIGQYSAEILKSSLPSNNLKFKAFRFITTIRYPNAVGEYAVASIDNFKVTLKNDAGQSKELTQDFDQYINGTIPLPDSLTNDIHEGTTTPTTVSAFKGDYSVLATSTNTYVFNGTTYSCNGASGYFTVNDAGTVSGSLLSLYDTPFSINGSVSSSGALENGHFVESGSIVVNYAGDFSASTASGTWSSLDGTGCTGAWTAKKDTLTSSITSSYLTANPWYSVDTDGDCNAKFTFNSNGTDIIIDYINDNGDNQTLNATYALSADSGITIASNIVGTITNTYFSSTLDTFTFSSSSNDGDSTQVAFKNYLDALDYGSANGNSGCSSYIPQ